jgi:hypothetical protein
LHRGKRVRSKQSLVQLVDVQSSLFASIRVPSADPKSRPNANIVSNRVGKSKSKRKEKNRWNTYVGAMHEGTSTGR